MKTSPNRIAVVALVLLVLAACLVWWLMQAKSGQAASRQPGARVTEEAGNEAGETPSTEIAAVSPRGPCATALGNALDDHARALLQRQDPISQLAYALTAPIGELPNRERAGNAEYQRAYTKIHLDREASVKGALLRAFALAPEDAEVRWLAAVYCGNDDACAAPRRALLAGEPDNMTVWLRELAWARQRGDQAGAQRAFVAAAGAPRFETHLGAEQEVILAAYDDLPLPAACATREGQRELRSLGPRGDDDVTMLDEALLRAQSMKFQSQPLLLDLRERCKPEVLGRIDATATEQCKKIQRRLAAQGSWMERAVALESLVAATAGEPDAAQWRERYREHQWMQSQMMEMAVQRSQATTELHHLTMDDYMFDEIRATQAALEVADRWPPPADWLPQDPRARSLILTGRPPESRR